MGVLVRGVWRSTQSKAIPQNVSHRPTMRTSNSRSSALSALEAIDIWRTSDDRTHRPVGLDLVVEVIRLPIIVPVEERHDLAKIIALEPARPDHAPR